MLWWAVMLFVMLPLTLTAILNNTPALVILHRLLHNIFDSTTRNLYA